MKVRVPVAIPVGDRLVKVKYVRQIVNEKNEHLFAETVVDDFSIRISKTMCKSDQDIMDTIFHELDHIFYQVSGHSQWLGEDREEALAYGRQYALARLFVFSPTAGIKYRRVDFDWDE